MDDDDGEELVLVLDGDVDTVGELHGLAYQAVCGRVPGVGITMGFQITDALKSLQLGDIASKAYVDALRRALASGDPQWD